MKVVLLAGGRGTRLSEETRVRPKPMVTIGGKPIIWHIMKLFSFYGFNDFVICLGYKGYIIKEYFSNYFLHTSDVTFHMDEDGRVDYHQCNAEPWKVTLIETGELTNTAGRILLAREYINNSTFFCTYGDGVSNVNLRALLDFHKSSSSLATLTSVRPPGRFGAVSVDNGRVISFQEKADSENAWINGGFFVLEPKSLDLVSELSQSWEYDILPLLASKGQLSSYGHHGFWHAMDTIRDREYLEDLWHKENPEWKEWS